MRMKLKLQGLTTVFEHKKWVFAYVLLFLIRELALAEVVSGSDIALMVSGLTVATLGASSFDKSQWRISAKNKTDSD